MLILCHVRQTTVSRQPCSKATAKLFHHLGRKLYPQQGHPSYKPEQNISTSSDALAQAMSTALTWHSRRVTQSQRHPIAAASAKLEFCGDLHVVAGSTDASLPRSGHDNRYLYCSLIVSTFSTLSAPAYGFSSLPLPSGSGSPTVGAGVVSAFPAISVSSAAAAQGFCFPFCPGSYSNFFAVLLLVE